MPSIWLWGGFEMAWGGFVRPFAPALPSGSMAVCRIENSGIPGQIPCACATTCPEAILAILNPPSAILFGCQADIRLRDGELPGQANLCLETAGDSGGNPANPTAPESMKSRHGAIPFGSRRMPYDSLPLAGTGGTPILAQPFDQRVIVSMRTDPKPHHQAAPAAGCGGPGPDTAGSRAPSTHRPATV